MTTEADEAPPVRGSMHEALSIFSASGGCFLIRDERAILDGKPIDTLFIIGVESGNGHFARTFENHGF